jgi:glycosyltransferase involved in cell wall biosynthesis
VKVWLVNQYATPASHSGGTRHHSLARALRPLGIELEIFCSTRNYLTGATIADAGTTERDGVTFTFVDTGDAAAVGRRSGRLATMFGFRRGFLRAARGRAEDPQVIVGSTPSLIGAWGAWEEAKRRAVPFVLEIRDLWPQTLVDVGGYSRWHPGVLAFGVLERALYQRARHIITLLPQAASHIRARSARAPSITWIPNGVDLDLTTRSPAAVRGGEAGARNGAFVVMYAGAHGPANALDAILDAAAMLERRQPGRFRFELIGDGHDKPRLRQRAKAERFDSVVFRDAVPKAEVYPLLENADALIANMNAGALYRSGISLNKLYDYLAVGRPVVFGADVANNPVVEADAGITVPPNDAGALALAVERLAALSPAEREAIGARGRAYVESHHDVARLAARFADVVRAAAVKPTGRPG